MARQLLLLLLLLLLVLVRGRGSLETGHQLDNTVRGEKTGRKTEKLSRGPPRVGPPRRRKGPPTVVGARGEEVRLVCPITGSPQPIVEWMKVSRLQPF